MFTPISLLFSHPLYFLVLCLALVISITIHEFAHAFVADKLGDPTPRLRGRLSLDPRAHLDPLGTLALFLVGFGWGKPVTFDPYNLRKPRQDAALIALAGPASNLILAILLSLVARVFQPSDWAVFLLVPIIAVNVSLAIFNLVPIHPLDGSRILIGLAPASFARDWEQLLSRYGFLILILLILPLYNGQSAIGSLISPVINFILNILI